MGSPKVIVSHRRRITPAYLEWKDVSKHEDLQMRLREQTMDSKLVRPLSIDLFHDVLNNPPYSRSSPENSQQPGELQLLTVLGLNCQLARTLQTPPMINVNLARNGRRHSAFE